MVNDTSTVVSTLIGSGPLGSHPSPYDPKDRYYKPDPDVNLKPQVNLREDYPKAIIPVYDQGSTESCVGNSTAAALWYELKKNDSDTLSPGGPSRLFIYYEARKKSLPANGHLSDNGTYNRAAMKCLDLIGACSESSFQWEFGVLATPPEDCYVEAGKHQISGYYRLDPDRPADPTDRVPVLSMEAKEKAGKLLLDRLKHCLCEGYPVVMGIRKYSWDFEWIRNTDTFWLLKDIWKDGKQQRHMKPGEQSGVPGGFHNFGGHSVLAIGYDDDREAVLVQNSLGSEVHEAFMSKDGLFWLPYVWVTDYRATYDFWTLRTHREAPSSFWLMNEIWEQVEATKLDIHT